MLPHQVKVKIRYNIELAKTSNQSSSIVMHEAVLKSETEYTVKSGDTLWAIARKYLGSGIKYTQIYEANKSTIEATAKKHGKSSSNNGNWIWPGEVLTIPTKKEKTIITRKQTSNSKLMAASSQSENDLGEKIANQMTAFSYTDVASGQSDSVSITMYDLSAEWLGKYMPKKGARIGADVVLTNWNEEGKKKFECGTFTLDDISFSGRPISCVLGAVSVPAMDSFKCDPKTKTWAKTTIQTIASEIAKKAGVKLVYDAGTIQIEEIEQSKQADSAFLYSLCEKYGLAMKVYNYKIVIFDIVAYEAKKAVATIKEKDMKSWDYNTTVDGTYTGVKLDYTNPDSKKETLHVKLGAEGRMYTMNTQASGQYDAELQAAAKVDAANRAIETMNINIRANTDIVASQCVNIEGLGRASGKYYIDSIKHSIGSSGYTMALKMHKVQESVLAKKKTKSASSDSNLNASGNTVGKYTVKSGDTLWAIAKKYLGSGMKYEVIYNANKDIIEATAKKHGKSSSNKGSWLWPGETLSIPEA